MTDERADQAPAPEQQSPETEPAGGYQEGKRAGAHPFVVVIGVVLGLWFLLWLYVPGSNTHQPLMPPPDPGTAVRQSGDEPVMFHIKAAVPELNVVTVVVPEQATDSQVVGLIQRFREARQANTLAEVLPATTPGHALGDNAIAEIFIFSKARYATADAVSLLARGAHTPGELYPRAIPFEVAMEHVRGHYRIDLTNADVPDQASLGFADESGVHSRHYRALF